MDAGLLRAFKKGDPDALETVYREHVGEVEGWLRGALLRAGRLTAADLGDLVQDVFLRAFSDAARASYDGLREYPPFLMTVARNRFVDWARRAGREIPGSDFLDDAVDQAPPAEADAPPFEPAVVAVVSAYLASLPEELRRIHHQRFVLATPQRQAAEALGISRQSLRTLEKKLVAGLRQRLGEAGIDAGEAVTAEKPNPTAAEGRRTS
jgi:RNA polymerase sigma-70 factor (ECF subfamily)